MLPKPIRNSSGKNKPAMYFEVLKGTFKGLNYKGIPKAISATPRNVDSRESIFDYEYLLEFGFKIEQVTTIA
jgi:adenine specific DNA methylase Mod